MKDSNPGPDNESLARRVSELEARLSGILDAAIEALIVIDEAGAIEIFNAAAEQMFGYSEADVVGRNVSMLMPAPDAIRHDQYIQKYLATGTPKVIGIGRETTAMRADGEEFPIDLSVGTVSVMGKNLFIGTIRDLSQQKEVELQLQDQRNRLAHAGRVTTMGEMASAIAHEINQPLTAIATYAQVCRRSLGAEHANTADIQDLLEQIYHQAMRAGEVLKRLRGFIQPLAQRIVNFDINSTVLATVKLAMLDTGHNDIDVKSELAEQLPAVRGDFIQIEQVLLNLIRNAVDALTESRTDSPTIIIRTYRNDEAEIVVEVADNGPGVPAESMLDLYKPFFTTKQQGTGLGLSISQTIIQSHGGRLSYADRDGGGARFWFSLPAAPDMGTAGG